MSEAEISASDIYLQPSVRLEKGKKYLIKANSGHGKTSILNFIYGSNSNFSGEIRYPYQKDSLFDLRRDKISYIFQDYKLFETLTAYENIILKNNLTKHKTPSQIAELLEKVGLSHRKDSLVKTLSLGQRQRIAIIRALCQPFDFLLLDEPFSHLDEENTKIVSQIILQEVDNQQSTLIMTALSDSFVFPFDVKLNL